MKPEQGKLTALPLYEHIDDIADQISGAIDGDFNLTVKVDVSDDLLEKLQIMVNLTLDAARRALEESREAHMQMIQSEKMAALGRLVAGVCHELNTPIGAIHSSNDTLERAAKKLDRLLETDSEQEIKPAEIQSILRGISQSHTIISNGVERVSDILSRLRSFARLDEADRKPVDIHKCIDDTLALLAFEIGEDIEIVRNYGEVSQILCFPAQINQVFFNLLTNARQAIDGKGRIKLETWQRGGEAYIAVKDDGAGIPKETLPKLFEPGFTTKNNRVSMGLGLSISYKIVEEHGGRILVESTQGKGTVFTVILPIWKRKGKA